MKILVRAWLTLIVFLILSGLVLYGPEFLRSNLSVGWRKIRKRNGDKTDFVADIKITYQSMKDWIGPNNNINGTTVAEQPKIKVNVEEMECKLPDLDPWHEKALPYINKTSNPLDGCIASFTEITYIKDGKVRLNKTLDTEGIRCYFRCYYHKNEFFIDIGNWTSIRHKPDCDIVEVNCTKVNDEDYTYNTMHAQIYRPDTSETKPTISESSDIDSSPPPDPAASSTDTPDRIDLVKPTNITPPNPLPDVHMIVFDSVAHTQFIRSMPSTVHVLRDEMEAIAFPYVNKIGINSRPNGYAMLFGKQAFKVEKSAINDQHNCNVTMQELCRRYLDSEQFVPFEFQKKGYKTLWAEDWVGALFTWPKCRGFAKPSADHYMRPFQLRLESGRYGEGGTLKEQMLNQMCKERHEHLIDYLKDFINKYPDQPKFSLTWLSSLAHNDNNGLFHVDMYFKTFLREFKEKFSNSFLFIMGDHGFRFGGIRKTKLGEVEDNNPLLMMVLPEHLRKNRQLVNNMKDNAKILSTHFDTFATLVDIAHNAHKFTHNSTFKNFDKSEINLTINGESYFHPYKLDKKRNCNNLRIPFDHCICQHQQNNISNEKEFAERLASFMLTQVNLALVEQNQTDLCVELTLNTNAPIEVLEFEPNLMFNAFKVTFNVLPGNGQLWGFVQIDGDRSDKNAKISMISERMSRLDEYEPTAFCCRNAYVKEYCYCRENLYTTTTTTTTEAP
ncbi:unnamed protein product [Bursaphelenchus okinawaensis]|uniref:Sulfatase domain-containing protein n=1 Tax=Bursaphelenchus okinawaensis TaxID=465554 RepID=A0A811JPX3_9BILA|nr:unnamed protein product [Bursaphelenchus okinawaensis]CAG9077271.1 unnamed protein product [Bursaphelenchus okinawaensis]